MNVQIRHARQEDYEKITSLLSSSSLPTEGVAKHLEHFLVAENESGVIGAIGLEVYQDTALLRSAVVHSSLQSKGIGSRLYEELIEYAKSLGVRRLILLTTTAEKYFERKGWKRIDATSVSGAITTSSEFRGACPSTATCMELLLTPEKIDSSWRQGATQNDKTRVLILCTGNSCRSQMAEGWLRHFGGGKLEVYSAGTRPCFVNPFAIAVMKEVGVDISSHRSKSVNELVEVQFDYVITVCNNAREECPYLPGANVLLHMPFDDPSFFDGTEEEQLNEFRRVREVIRAEMEGFAESLTKE